MGLLFVGGFFCFGVYPILVSIARNCKGTSFGHRMGWVVGGVWLIASAMPILLGPVAKSLGTGAVVFIIPIGFAVALVLTIKRKRQND